MSIFQIISTLFAFLMLYIVSIHKKRAGLNKYEVIYWHILWFSFIIISLFPNILFGIVNIFNFARVFDLLIVIAFMILSLLIVISYFNQKILNKKLRITLEKKQ